MVLISKNQNKSGFNPIPIRLKHWKLHDRDGKSMTRVSFLGDTRNFSINYHLP